MKNVLITGAASGIGAAIARLLADDGHALILVDRDAERLASMKETLGDACRHTLALDITDEAAVADLMSDIPDACRPIDTLINNAGHDIGGTTRFDVGAAADWASIIRTNLIGTMCVTRAVLPGMVERNQGEVINMGSIAGLRIVPDMTAYNASKWGIHGFTENLRADLQDTAIRVTEIMPGLTETNIIRTRYRGDEEKTREWFERFRIALKPEDVARCVRFAMDMPAHAQVAHLTVLPVNRW